VDALDQVPLFPLPGHVLLPGLPVPFHIFEPRYRALITDLQELPPERRWLAIPRIALGHEADAGGLPPLLPVVTAARLVAATPLPDSRFLIAVVGEGRWRLSEFLAARPYRLARLERLAEPPAPADLAERVATAVRRHLGPCPAVAEDVLALLDVCRHPPAEVLDRLASLTLVDPDLRQRFLEAVSAECRLRVLTGAECCGGSTAATALN
jgi:Lon protease-like protein